MSIVETRRAGKGTGNAFDIVAIYQLPFVTLQEADKAFSLTERSFICNNRPLTF
jgi:hypothetical protein